MRGDVSIIEGKLCYAFDVSDAWLSRLNDKSRFFKGKDEWKVKSVVGDTAWCYQINPFKYGTEEMEKLSRRLDKVEGWMKEIIRENNKRVFNEQTFKTLKLRWRIKLFINRISMNYLHFPLFKIPDSMGYVVDLQPIFL